MIYIPSKYISPKEKLMKKNFSSATLSILIPVRNEGVNLKILLKILTAVLDFPYEIIIIYDLLDDDSVPVVRNFKKQNSQIKLVHNRLGNGVANAIKTGIRRSTGEYILIFAADEVGPVLAIDDMLDLMKKGCDLVSCTRYAYGGRRLGGSLTQAILSRLGNRLFRLLIKTALTDSTTGIKMFRREIFSQIVLESKVGWAVVLEVVIKAQILGKKFGEVPIISIDRLYGGESSFKLGPWLKEYLRWFLFGVFRLHTSKKQKVMLKIPKSMVF